MSVTESFLIAGQRNRPVLYIYIGLTYSTSHEQSETSWYVGLRRPTPTVKDGLPWTPIGDLATWWFCHPPIIYTCRRRTHDRILPRACANTIHYYIQEAQLGVSGGGGGGHATCRGTICKYANPSMHSVSPVKPYRDDPAHAPVNFAQTCLGISHDAGHWLCILLRVPLGEGRYLSVKSRDTQSWFCAQVKEQREGG